MTAGGRALPLRLSHRINRKRREVYTTRGGNLKEEDATQSYE